MQKQHIDTMEKALQKIEELEKQQREAQEKIDRLKDNEIKMWKDRAMSAESLKGLIPILRTLTGRGTQK